jgi:hypothetical protein
MTPRQQLEDEIGHAAHDRGRAAELDRRQAQGELAQTRRAASQHLLDDAPARPR